MSSSYRDSQEYDSEERDSEEEDYSEEEGSDEEESDEEESEEEDEEESEDDEDSEEDRFRSEASGFDSEEDKFRSETTGMESAPDSFVERSEQNPNQALVAYEEKAYAEGDYAYAQEYEEEESSEEDSDVEEDSAEPYYDEEPEVVVIEVEEYPGDEDEEKKEDRTGAIAALLCCLCCCCLILAAILLFIFLRRDDDPQSTKEIVESPAPSFLEEPVILPAVADTYIRGGADADTSFGTMESFQVQNAGDLDGDVAIALLQFDLVGLPPENEERQREIILQLSHVESAVDKEHEITLVQVPADPDVDIESLTWNTYDPPPGVDGPSFVVEESDTTVTVDITSLVESSNANLRGRRGLQEDRLFIRLESRGSEEVGSLFRSREFPDEELRPKIIHNFILPEPTGTPSLSSQPSVSEQPSVSHRPTMAPSVSLSPSTPKPSLSPQPTTSLMPSQAPSVSVAPSASAMPSSMPTGTSQVPSLAPSSVPSPVITESTEPSSLPTASHQPSTSMSPSAPPSVSLQPTITPTTTPPTLSASPTSAPTITPQPSTSVQPSVSSRPTSCLEWILPFIVPPMYDSAGATANEFPEGALTYVSQLGNRVTLRITQLWSESEVVWIAPFFFENGVWNCPKERGVAPGATLDYTVPCFDRQAVFLVIVNDWSISHGLDLVLLDECSVDGDDIEGQKVLYAFLARCDGPPVECDNSGAA